MSEFGSWQAIDCAPRDGKWVIAVRAGLHPTTGAPFVPSVVRFEHGVWVNSDAVELSDDHRWRPSHWMPLPALPGEAVHEQAASAIVALASGPENCDIAA